MNINLATFPQPIQQALNLIPEDRHFLALAVMCPDELYYTFNINKGVTEMTIAYEPIPASSNIVTPTQTSIT